MSGMEILDKLLPYVAAAGVSLVGGLGILWHALRADQKEMIATLRAELDALRARVEECEADRQKLHLEVKALREKVATCEIRLNGDS